MKSKTIWAGLTQRAITEKDVREIQRSLMRNKMTPQNAFLIDAILSHFVKEINGVEKVVVG